MSGPKRLPLSVAQAAYELLVLVTVMDSVVDTVVGKTTVSVVTALIVEVVEKEDVTVTFYR